MYECMGNCQKLTFNIKCLERPYEFTGDFASKNNSISNQMTAKQNKEI